MKSDARRQIIMKIEACNQKMFEEYVTLDRYNEIMDIRRALMRQLAALDAMAKSNAPSCRR